MISFAEKMKQKNTHEGVSKDTLKNFFPTVAVTGDVLDTDTVGFPQVLICQLTD